METHPIKHAIVLHVFYRDLWQEFKPYLEKILADESVHLYVTIVNDLDEYPIENLEGLVDLATKIYYVENRGYDIGPFLTVMQDIRNKDYNTITKLHTKKSLHNGWDLSWGANWRKDLYKPLIGHPKLFQFCIEQLQQPKIGMIGSKKYFYGDEKDQKHRDLLPSSLLAVNQLLKKHIPWNGGFISGTMFIIKTELLLSLFDKVTDLKELVYHFPLNEGKHTIAHAFERIFGYWTKYQEQEVGLI